MLPWDIKPIIRWHHEKYDGSGYPDRLHGHEIPVMEALIRIQECRGWWRPRSVTRLAEAA